MGKGNINNLIPNSQRTPEQIHAMTVAGGIASGVARRAKRDMVNTMKLLLDTDSIDEDTGKLADTRTLLSVAQIRKALKGDTKAFNAIIGVIGEKVADKHELTGADGNPIESVRYIEPEEYKRVQDHIDKVVGDTNDEPDD